MVNIFCECNAGDCAQLITIEQEKFNDILSKELFCVAPGHEEACDEIIEKYPKYFVVKET